MKTKMKALTLVLCAVMLVATTVFATVAYLTSTTATVENTFTVGNVAITLDEADVDANGVILNDTRVTANEYKLMPGHFYVKDPTVHVDANSEYAWLFVKVENEIANIEANTEETDKTVSEQMTELGWTPVAGTSNVYAYKDIVAKGDNIVVFNNFKIAGTVDNATLASYSTKKITVQAYAVQADGFATAAAAWEAAPLAAWTTPATNG